MNNLIESWHCDKTYNMLVEADIGADAIWCKRCYCNLDIEYVPISIELKTELTAWTSKYGEWIDWDNEGYSPMALNLKTNITYKD